MSETPKKTPLLTDKKWKMGEIATDWKWEIATTLECNEDFVSKEKLDILPGVNRLKSLVIEKNEWIDKYKEERNRILESLQGDRFSKPNDLLYQFKKGISKLDREELKNKYFEILKPVTEFFIKLYSDNSPSSVIVYFKNELFNSQLLPLSRPRYGSTQRFSGKLPEWFGYLWVNLGAIVDEYLDKLWIQYSDEWDDWDSAIYPIGYEYKVAWAQTTTIKAEYTKGQYPDQRTYPWFKELYPFKEKSELDNADLIFIYRDNDLYQKFHDKMEDLVGYQYWWRVVFIVVPEHVNKDQLGENSINYLRSILEKYGNCITDSTISEWTWVDTKKFEDVLSQREFEKENTDMVDENKYWEMLANKFFEL